MNNEKVEIYTSRKKSIHLLIFSLIGVITGFYLIINANNITRFNFEGTLYLRSFASIIIFFFGAGLYVSAKPFIKNKPLLIIDEVGINVDQSKSLIIRWNNVTGFSEESMLDQQFIIIRVNNPEYWIESENSWIRKKFMKYNFNNYGSPFNLSTNSMKINHRELMRLLNENFKKYKK